MDEIRSKRVAAMITPRLRTRAEKMAFNKKWTLSTYIEEAIIEKVAIDEEFFAAKKK